MYTCTCIYQAAKMYALNMKTMGTCLTRLHSVLQRSGVVLIIAYYIGEHLLLSVRFLTTKRYKCMRLLTRVYSSYKSCGYAYMYMYIAVPMLYEPVSSIPTGTCCSCFVDLQEHLNLPGRSGNCWTNIFMERLLLSMLLVMCLHMKQQGTPRLQTLAKPYLTMIMNNFKNGSGSRTRLLPKSS